MVGQLGACWSKEYRAMPLLLLQEAAPSCNLSYLAAAFGASWVVFFLYVFFVNRKQQEMGREISRLRYTLEEPGVRNDD